MSAIGRTSPNEDWTRAICAVGDHAVNVHPAGVVQMSSAYSIVTPGLLNPRPIVRYSEAPSRPVE